MMPGFEPWSRQLKQQSGDNPNPAPRKGRGSLSNRSGRYEALERGPFDDGWGTIDEPLAPLRTTLTRDASRTIIARNESPDVPFDRSINPYRGCEHGCSYCFARPTHAYLGLSPGLDFETRLFYKPAAAALLRDALVKPGYECRTMELGTNTDPYQPTDRKLQLTRQILEVLAECDHPVGIVTKSALVERDIDILGSMASKGLASVAVSVTTLDRELARKMEPRAAAPQRRITTVRRLAEAGIPVSVFVAPVIPALNDNEIETILETVHEAGAGWASYVMLRLPLEIVDLFNEWLHTHYPLKAEHVMNRMRDLHGGKVYDSTFGVRQRGTGQYASLISKRFEVARRRLGFRGVAELDCTRFRPTKLAKQMQLF